MSAKRDTGAESPRRSITEAQCVTYPEDRGGAIAISITDRSGGARAIGARGFDPNANGTINVVVVQPDGKSLGGDFTTLSPNGGPAVTRNHLAD